MRALTLSFSLLALTALAGTAAYGAERPIRFWNLTANTITTFKLAPAGTKNWSANQTANDRDGTVDYDERLNITGIEAGVFDVEFTDSQGRTCLVENVAIKAAPEIFSIEEKDLSPTACRKK